MPSTTKRSEPTVGETNGTDSVEPRQTIYERMVAAQSEIGNVTKNAVNSFFKDPKGKASKFVDLAALNDAAIPVLNRHGLFVMQRIELKRTSLDAPSTPVVVTQVFDDRGFSLPSSDYPIIAKDASDPQKFGAGVTYARRYALMAYLGVAAEDDDGNTAAQSKPKVSPELDTLANNLKDKGVSTKDDVQKLLDERFGKGLKNGLRSLTPDEIKSWNDEFTQEGPTAF